MVALIGEESSHLVISQPRTLQIVVVAMLVKQRDINGSDKYVTLKIPLKFDNLDKMKIKSSE